MMEKEHIYVAIDLKSFYASIECMERQLDPMNTNLVVADTSRTEKTICLAVWGRTESQGCKPWTENLPAGTQTHGESYFAHELLAQPEFSVSYLIAPPRMAHYMEYSVRICEIYLRISRRRTSMYTSLMRSLWISPYI